MNTSLPVTTRFMTESFPVKVDYRIGVDAAVAANNFEEKFIDSECQIPTVGRGRVTRLMALRHYNRGLTTQKAWDAIGEKSFGDPMTALAFAREYRDEQRKFPIIILWKKDRTFMCLVLGGKADWRFLRVSSSRPNCRWPKNVRYLEISQSV